MNRRLRLWNFQTKSLMLRLLIAMLHILLYHPMRVRLPDDQSVIEAFTSYALQEPLAREVSTWRKQDIRKTRFTLVCATQAKGCSYLLSLPWIKKAGVPPYGVVR